MARPHLAAAARAGRQGRTLIFIVLALLAIAGGTALALGFPTRSRPLDASISAERPGITARASVVSRVELTDCDPMELDEATRATPPR